MNSAPEQGGASVRLHGKVPSVDLSSLIASIVEALRAPSGDKQIGPSEPIPDRAVFRDPVTHRLVFDTHSVLKRLYRLPDFKQRFKQTEDSGFLRDVRLPPFSQTAMVGGRLFDQNLQGISDGVAALKAALKAELDAVGISPENLLVPNAGEAIKRLAQETNAVDFNHEFTAQMVPVEFTRAGQKGAEKDKDVARVICVEEEVQAEDWLARLTNTVVELQAHRDDEFDSIQQDKLRETLRQDARKSDSQVTQFLNFLEDEALARVRLAVSFAIMRALAAQITVQKAPEQAFVEYVTRVLSLFELYGTPDLEDGLELNLSREFGFENSFLMSSELVKATFYYCLPVWPEWATQIFESRQQDPETGGVTVTREVSYRFRVNGRDPSADQLHSFDARLQRHRQVLTSEGQSPQKIRKAVAESVFLWLVLNPGLAGKDLREEAEALAKRLSAGGKRAIDQLLNELQSCSGQVQQLSVTLVHLLRSKSGTVITHAQKAAQDLYVVVQAGVVDWTSIEYSRGRVHDPLVKPREGIAQNIEWFKYIKITPTPESVPDNLFSVRVRTRMSNRTLTSHRDEVKAIRTRRMVPERLLNIVWVPMEADGRASPPKITPRANIESVWKMGPGIDIWYAPEGLRRRQKKDVSGEDQSQYRAAAASALTVLVRVFLHLIAEAVNVPGQERVAALMLRFQMLGREAAPTEGDPLVYAAAHAVATSMMRELPLRMQGMVVNDKNQNYRKQGTVFALASAFPLHIEASPSSTLPRIATIVYSTRPCDDHPELTDADGFLFRAKTYLADSASDPFPGYRLCFDRMQSHVLETHDEFRHPKLLVEEVARLHALGYNHIILLSHHFGNRRLNRSAQRHSPHTQTEFLDEISSKFSSVCLYMLRRDVFPATRLHQRASSESAFEVSGLSEHNEFTRDLREGLIKALIPVYTLATLAIVGTDDIAKPQSGFCTYFLDTDYRVRDTEWRERIRSNLMGANDEVRSGLLAVLRGIHFLEAEKVPQGGRFQDRLFQPVLDPYGWASPSSSGAAGEIEVTSSRRRGTMMLSLPALLSHVTDALHRGRR